MAKYLVLGLVALLVVTTSEAMGWLHVFPEKDLKSMARRSLVGGEIEQIIEGDIAFTPPTYGYMINSSSFHFFNEA